MSQEIEYFTAQWRASAHEAVPYTEDFPESFLVLPELIDGAIGQGSASKIKIEIKFIDDNNGYLKITDNGNGVKNPSRLLSWASTESTSIHHRYGHGSKKCLTKWNKNYDSNWYVKYRHKRTKGVDALFCYKSPFRGIKTPSIQNDEDEIELMPSGLEWYIEFTRDILNNKNSVRLTFDSIKEIIRTRYSRYYLDKVDFILKVSDDKEVIEQSSNKDKWTSFEEEVINEIKLDNCREIFNKEIDFCENTKVTYKVYSLTIDGNKSFNLKKEFYTYGQKNMNCSRIYISLNQRIIEVAPFWKFVKDREANHNSLNGLIAFINFENVIQTDNEIYVDNLPTPCTTKVSFYENCKNFIKMRDILINLNQNIIKEKLNQPKKTSSPTTPTKKTSSPTTPTKKTTSTTTPTKKTTSTTTPTKKTTTKYDNNDDSDDVDDDSDEDVEDEDIEDEDVEDEDVEDEDDKDNLEKNYKSKRKCVSKNIKDLVWNTYIGENIALHKCACCKIRYIKQTDFHCGHIQSVANGGSDAINNLRPICKECNYGMKTMNMIDYIIYHQFYVYDKV